MLVNDVSLRNLIPAELAKGFGFFHGKPSTAFSPVAVTPDELGPAWQGGKVHLPLLASINGKPLGRPNAGRDMTFSFPDLIAHAARTRRLGAGSIIGSGTVSNKDGDGPGKPVDQGGAGYTCLAEVRTVETILEGKPKHAVPAVRRPRQDRDAGCRRPLDLRRHRAGGGALRQGLSRTSRPWRTKCTARRGSAQLRQAPGASRKGRHGRQDAAGRTTAAESARAPAPHR